MSGRAASPPTVAALAVLAALAAIVLVGPARAWAQQAPVVQAVAGFDPPSATIGDRVTFSVRVTHPADVILKATTPQIEHVDLITVIPPATVASPADPHVTTFSYTLQPFLLGTLDTGPVRLSWLRADGTTGTLDVPGAQLLITAVRAADDQALRPLKPPVSIAGAPPAWLRPAIAAGALLAVLLIAAGAWRLLRRRPAPTEAPASTLDRSPEGVARGELDALAAYGQPGRMDYESYYGGLALTVRTYLAARFGFNAHALTTRELERRMVSHGVDRWQARLVAGLLDRCDGAVYAHRYPDPASADHDLTVAYEIVELSRPRERAGGEAAPA